MRTRLLMKHGRYLYVGHVGLHGTSLLDVGDPSNPRVVGHLEAPPHASAPKGQTVGDLLMVNVEQRGAEAPPWAGLALYSLEAPVNPRQIGVFETGGKGVHRMWYTGGRYACLSAVPEGYTGRILLLVDVSDPTRPSEVGRWWWPGMWTAGGETPAWPAGLRYQLHHALVHGDRAYAGLWDGGMAILDLTHLDRPTVVSRVAWAPEGGGCTHTALLLPERQLLVVTDESVRNNCQEPSKRVRVFDVSDERRPRLLSLCPVPRGDFCQRGMWFGSHNLHENRPDTHLSDRVGGGVSVLEWE